MHYSIKNWVSLKFALSLLFYFFIQTFYGQQQVYTVGAPNSAFSQQVSDFFDDPPEVNVNVQFPIVNAQAIQLTDIGLNSFITYNDPEGRDDDLNGVLDAFQYSFADPDFQSTIQSLGPKHLRFVGGTPSNSRAVYSSVIEHVLSPGMGENNIEQEYFVDFDDHQNFIQDDGNFDFAANNYYILNEGSSSNFNGLQKMNAVNPDNLHDAVSNELFYNSLQNVQEYLRIATSFYEEDGLFDLSLFEDDGIRNDREFNYLADFIEMTYDQGIKPVYVVRMFDPHNFVVAFGDGGVSGDDYLANIEVYNSPLMELRMTDDPLYTLTSFDLCTDYTEMSNFIIRESGNQIKRQIVKYVYEYFKYLCPPADQQELLVDFNNFINSVNDDMEWLNFVQFVTTHNLYPRIEHMEIFFEMGNELWSEYYYKFLPNQVSCTAGIPQWEDFSTSELLYADLCAQADDWIKQIFLGARTGVVAGNRGGNCDWMSTLDANLTYSEDPMSTDFDAWISHFYSAYSPLGGDTFDPVNLESAANEGVLGSALTTLYARMVQDVQSGNFFGDIPVWITENGMSSQCNQDGSICEGPLPGSWFDMIGKFGVLNQLISRDSELQNDLNASPLVGLSKVYNSDNTLTNSPSLNIEMLLWHTLKSNVRGSIEIEPGAPDPYEFKEQGLLQLIMDKITDEGFNKALPIQFTIDSNTALIEDNEGSGVQGNYIDDSAAINLCGPLSTAVSSPLFYGWMLQPENNECFEYRYLLVNASHESVGISGMDDINTMNADLFLFDTEEYVLNGETQLEAMTINGGIVDQIQDPSVIGAFNPETYFCYITGDLNDPGIDIDFSSEILMPPYSVMVFEGDPDALAPGSDLANILAIQNFPLTTISGDPQFNGNFWVNQDIVIPDNMSLTLNDANLYFDQNIGIIVKPGGRLIVNNSTLTSQYCENTWRGIDVQGDSNLSQSPTGTNQYDQGRIDMNNSTIRNAEIALTNFDRNDIPWSSTTTGGILHCETSEFINCNRAVQMAPYFNFVSSGLLHEDVSIFEQCNFIWDETFDKQIPDQINAQVFLEKVNDVKFHGCHFSNLNMNQINIAPGIMTGVYASFATIKMTEDCDGITQFPCPEEDIFPSSVKGFQYGIYLNGAPSAITKTAFQNAHSIFAIGAAGGRYTENEFSVLEDDLFQDMGIFEWHSHYGMYMHSCTGYWIEGNNFDFACSSEDRSGLIILNSGGFSNQVYDNTFQNCSFGTIAYDSNRGDDPFIGLNYDCNDYLYNLRDLNTSDSEIALNTLNFGIAMNQGLAPSGGNGTSAGNYFEGINSGAEEYDLRNDITGYTVNYFYHDNDNLDDTSPFGIQGLFNVVELNIDENGCLSNLDRDRLERLAKSTESNADAENNKAILAALVDGGNTEDLLTDIIIAQYQDALALYYELMAESPYLSEEVMAEAIQKEAELPAVLLTLILQSNPHAAKSSEVNQRLDERIDPLSQYQRDMVNQGLAVIGNKEAIESQYAHHLKEYEVAMNQAIYHTLNDENIADKLAAIDAELVNKESLSQRYYRAQLYAKECNFSMVNQLLADADSDFELSPRQEQELEDLEYCYGIMQSASPISATEINALTSISENENSFGAGLARALLNSHASDIYYEPLVNPLTMEKARSAGNGKPTENESPNEVKFYPNPANDYFVIENGKQLDGRIILYDQNGKMVMTDNISANNPLQVVNVSNLSSGLYQLRIESIEGHVVYSDKLTVKR